MKILLPLFLIATVIAVHAAEPAAKPAELAKRNREAAPEIQFVPREITEKNYAAFRARGNANGIPRTDPAMKIERSEPCAGYVRHLISYNTEPDERIDGWLLVPDDLKPGEKRPLILTLHGTNVYGKDAPINDYRNYPPSTKPQEPENRRQRAFAEELVQRGFICFAPDRPGYGKRCPDQPATGIPGQNRYIKQLAQKHPDWSYNGGKVIHDLQQALDFLVKMDNVDAANIGVIGHSLGGHDSLYLAAADPRITVVVASCYGCVHFLPELWTSAEAQAKLCQTAPKGGSQKILNMALQMIVPRPMLLLHAWNDYLYRPPAAIIEAQTTIWSYYVDQLGGDKPFKAKAPFSLYHHSAGHAVPTDARMTAYAFFERHLKAPAGAQ